MIGVDGVADWFRVILVISSLVILCLMVFRLLHTWGTYHHSQQMILIVVGLYNIQQAGRSFELIRADTDWSFWLVFGLIANTLMVIYLLEPRAFWSERVGDNLWKHK